MKVDVQTLRDLDVLGTQDLSLSVFALVDRTRSAAGRERLRERFRAPPATDETLRATQDAVRFLTAHERYRVIDVDGEQFAAVQRYASSNLTPISVRGSVAAMMESRWVAMRYPELLHLARNGVPASLSVVHWADRWAADLLEHEPPRLLRRLAEEVHLATRHVLRPALDAPPTDDHSTTRLLVLDQLLRGTQRAAFNRLTASVAEADALVSLAVATVQLGLHFPELVATRAPLLELSALWHPFLPDPVPNDLTLGGNRRLLFLTGPNMAGKSTLLKACGVAVYLAQLGMGVPARSMRWSFRDRLISSIDADDDIGLGYSYFFSEVQRVRQIAEAVASGARCLVLCDELFRGTNVMDAQDATKLVLRGFAATDESLFLASSHLVELVEELSLVDGIAFACLEGELRGDELHFDYRLRGGHSAQRLGLVLLERAGVPALLASRTTPA